MTKKGVDFNIVERSIYFIYDTDSKLFVYHVYWPLARSYSHFFKILINSCGRTEFLFPEILIIKEKKNLTGDLPACLNLFLFWCQIFQIIITLDMLELQVFLFLFDHVG